MRIARLCELAGWSESAFATSNNRDLLPFPPVPGDGYNLHHAFCLRLMDGVRKVTSDKAAAAALARDIADANPYPLTTLAAVEIVGARVRLTVEGPSPVGFDRVFVGRLDRLHDWLERERRFIARGAEPHREIVGRAAFSILTLIELGAHARAVIELATPEEVAEVSPA
jgi:hypothetical protein